MNGTVHICVGGLLWFDGKTNKAAEQWFILSPWLKGLCIEVLNKY